MPQDESAISKWNMWWNRASGWFDNFKKEFSKVIGQLNSANPPSSAKLSLQNLLTHAKKWKELAETAVKSGKLQFENNEIVLDPKMKDQASSFAKNLSKMYQHLATASVLPQIVQLADRLDHLGLKKEADAADKLLVILAQNRRKV